MSVGTTMTVIAALREIAELFRVGNELAEMLHQAQLEGRTTLNVDEWNKVRGEREKAFARLDASIAVAQANGGADLRPASNPPPPMAGLRPPASQPPGGTLQRAAMVAGQLPVQLRTAPDENAPLVQPQVPQVPAAPAPTATPVPGAVKVGFPPPATGKV